MVLRGVFDLLFLYHIIYYICSALITDWTYLHSNSHVNKMKIR